MHKCYSLALFLLLFSLSLLAQAVDFSFYGPGLIGDARAVAIAPNGDIWVGNSGQIVIFSPNGQYKKTMEQVGGQVNSILFNPKGELIIGFNDHYIAYYRGEDRHIVDGFSGYSPWEVTLDDKGFLYATDAGSHTAKKITIEGALPQIVTTYKAPEDQQMIRPYSLALDKENRLYVTDDSQPGIWLFQNDGTFIKRLLPTVRCYRIRTGSDGLYVVTDSGVSVLKALTGEVLRQIETPAGINNTRGFALAADGTMYFGSFYGGVVQKTTPDGKLIATIGPSFRATLTVNERWTPGETVALPWKIETISTIPTGQIPPIMAFNLLPARQSGEADSNFRDYGPDITTGAWQTTQQNFLKSMTKQLPSAVGDNEIKVTTPADITSNLYRFQVIAHLGFNDEHRDFEAAVRVVQTGATGNMTLFIPRQRTVFQQGEAVELNAIIRSSTPLPTGILKFMLAQRDNEKLDFQTDATRWQQISVPAIQLSSTLTFQIAASGIHSGRYLLQAEYTAGNQIYHDTWPIQIVNNIPETNYQIIFPEWSAGYTDNCGPFTGNGMRGDAKKLGDEGLNLVDIEIMSRSQNPPFSENAQDVQRSRDMMAQAKADPSLPAPEHYLLASPLEIQLQEAIRNRFSVQRDIWGGWFLNPWGMADPLGVQRDNRLPQLWTQWQREWPSWIGHRYLCLSLDEGNNPERMALIAQCKENGLIPPGDTDLNWVRNGFQRRFITDAPSAAEDQLPAVGADKAGNIYICFRSGILVKYLPDGKMAWTEKVTGGVLDLAVSPDGTVFTAAMGAGVTVVTPDQQISQWIPAGFDGYSPRGIAYEPGGTLLISLESQGSVYRYTADGKLVSLLIDKKNLQRPAGIAVLSDGNIAVVDGGRGGVALFKQDGSYITFLAGVASHIPGGKGDVCADTTGGFWSTRGWGDLGHYDQQGKLLGTAGHSTFAPGGMSLPTSVAMLPNGNILQADVALPYVQEFTSEGKYVRMFGVNTLLADIRIDRQRYTWTDRIIAQVWMPVPGLEGDTAMTLQAYAKAANGDWQALLVQKYNAGDFAISTPQMNGDVTLRLIWAPPGATAENSLHTDFPIIISEKILQNDQDRASDIIKRQQAWVRTWAKTRMGTLTRWTQLSDVIRPGTKNTAPTNYGTPDSLAEAVWVPWRADALVAEAENEGHDHGSFPLMGPFYVARALEGPKAKPAWSSLLSWYWNHEKDAPISPRPMRDAVLLLGTGASGMGVGKLVTSMDEQQLTLHRKLVQRLRRLGDTSLKLDLPGKNGVAVLHSFTQEAMDVYMNEQFYTAHAAWYDLMRAHVPTAIISEESIAQGALTGRYKAVLLPCIQFPLPADVMAALEKYRLAGGEIWLDLGSRISIPGAKLLKTRYRPFWSEDAYFNMHDGYGVAAYDGNFEYWCMRQGSDQRLPAILEAFSRFTTDNAVLNDPNIYLQERQGGQGSYIFASNDHFPDKPLGETWLAGQTPAPADATINFNGKAIYDALTMQPVTEKQLKVEFTDEEPARIWAILPAAISNVIVRGTPAPNQLGLAARVTDGLDKTIPAVIPLEVTVTDANGTLQYHLWRTTDATGLYMESVPLGWMALAGQWTITVKELLSGKTTSVKTAIAGKTAPTISQISAPVLTFDGKAISSWLTAMKGKEVWIPLDQAQTALKDDAQKLAAALVQRGVNAKVVEIANIPEIQLMLAYTLTNEQQDDLRRVQLGIAVGQRRDPGDNSFVVPGPQRVIMRPLILMGDPAENRWLADIQNFFLTRRQLSPCYPGTGRALLQYVWTPFYDGFDAVTISANDIEGVRAGIKGLLAQ